MCLASLIGMFAVALWRVDRRELTLARDHVGIKPLYVAELGQSLAFASELKPLLTLAGVDRRIDHEGLGLGLTLGVLPAPWTLARGVRQLEPGEALRWRDGVSRRWRYSARIGVPAERERDAMPRTAQGRERALEDLLATCVRDQLVSDVPLGVLLSGGVDSSLIASFAAAEVRGVKTFSIVHPDPAYDERHAARAVARHLGTEHIELELRGGEMSEDELFGVVDHHGDPFADSSSLPTRRLAREVRRHVTVALSGDGGDELFAGYPRYPLSRLIDGLARLPGPLLRVGGACSAGLARHADSRLTQPSRRIARALLVSARNPAERALATKTWFWPDELADLLQPAFTAGLDGLLPRLVAERSVAGFPPQRPDGLHRLEQHLVLPDDMLTKVDRMTMAESLEIRPPLLDQRVTRFAAALPLADKLDGREGKAILKRIARRRVPPEVIDRPKKGFALPLIDYGGDVLAHHTERALCAPDAPLRGLFRPPVLATLRREFERRGDGVLPEDSAYRRRHRQYLLVLLNLTLERHGLIA